MLRFTGIFAPDIKPKEPYNVPYSSALFRSSILLLPITVATAYYYCVWGGVICSGLVTCTSINHWRNPKDCWRRSIDVVVVRLAFLYHLFWSINPKVFFPYGLVWLLLAACAISLYTQARGFGRQSLYYKASLSHLGLHICSVIANCYVYRGIQLRTGRAV